MRTTGGVRGLGLSALMLAAALTACGQDQESAGAFAPYPGHVGPGGGWAPENVGVKRLVPVGDCVIGLGTRNDGYRTVGANWLGTPDCTRLDLFPAAGATGGDEAQARGGSGNGIGDVPAVAGPGEAVTGAADTFVRLGPDGQVTRLAELTGVEKPKAVALVRATRNLVAFGGYPGNPVAWLSADEGATARLVRLPRSGVQPEGSGGPYRAGAAGDRIVATGFTALPEGEVWASDDGGETWRFDRTPALPRDTNLYGALPTPDGWLLYGAAHDGRAPNVPVVVTGTPGNWTVADTGPMGAGGIIAATVDHAGRPVLLGRVYQPYEPGKNTEYCSVVWSRTPTGWQREQLGCGDQPASVVTTLRDGRVLVASARDLWIRPA